MPSFPVYRLCNQVVAILYYYTDHTLYIDYHKNDLLCLQCSYCLLSGMPVELVKGQVMLLADWRVCSEGEVLTSEQARILKLLGHQHAQFRLNIVSGWSKEGGNFQLYKQIEMRGQGGGGSGGEAEDSDGEELEED